MYYTGVQDDRLFTFFGDGWVGRIATRLHAVQLQLHASDAASIALLHTHLTIIIVRIASPEDTHNTVFSFELVSLTIASRF